MLVPGVAVAAVGVSLTARLGRLLGYPWTMAAGAIFVCLGYAGLVFFHATLPEFIICGAVAYAGFGASKAPPAPSWSRTCAQKRPR